MNIKRTQGLAPKQVKPAVIKTATTEEPNPNPTDSVSLGQGLLRSGKAALPGLAGGAAGAVLGTGAFYTFTFGRAAASMAFQFPEVIGVGAVAGGLTAAAVEGLSGEGENPGLSRAAMVGGAVGAGLGVAIQMAMWSKPF